MLRFISLCNNKLTLNDIENVINTHDMTLKKSKAVPMCHSYASQVRPPQEAVVRALKRTPDQSSGCDPI